MCGDHYDASLNILRNTSDRTNEVTKNIAVIPADCVSDGVRPHIGKSQYVAAHDMHSPTAAFVRASMVSMRAVVISVDPLACRIVCNPL